MQRVLRNFGRELLEWGQIVEYPNGAPVSAHNEVVVPLLLGEVVNRSVRQPEPEQVPLSAVVPRNVQSILQACIIHVRIAPVAMRHMRINLRQIAGDGLPRRAVIAGAIDIRLEVAVEMAIYRDNRISGIVRGKIYRLDATPRWKAGNVRCYVRPACAAIARDLHLPVIGADPEHARILPRGCDADDGVENLSAGVVFHYRSARRLLLALVIHREVGADGLPGAAAVLALEDHVAACIERRRVGGRNRTS